MHSMLDNAIAEYTRTRTEAHFLAIYRAVLTENLLVPVAESVKEVQTGQYDVPVICIRTETGAGAIPVFTSTEHLLKWKPHGCLYATLTGRALLTMAVDMHEVSEIQINPNDVPHGRIPRVDFVNMLDL